MTRLLILLLLAAASAQAQTSAPQRVEAGTTLPTGILAVAGADTITAEVFLASYGQALLRSGQADDARLRARVLSALVAERLMAREADAMGLDDDPDVALALETDRRSLLLSAFARDRFYDTQVVTPEQFGELVRRVYIQTEARHLYATTQAGAATLAARLKAGETFETLAREVFADSALAASGGYLGTFGFDEMDPAFERAAMELEIGEVSQPVRTALGWSVIEVISRTNLPRPTPTELAAKRPELEAYLKRTRALDARTSYVREQTAALDARYEADVLSDLASLIVGTAVVPSDEALAGWLGRTLVTFGPASDRRAWTLGDVREIAALVPDETRARVRSDADLRAFVEGLIVQQAMLDQAESLALDQTLDFASQMAAARNRRLVDARRMQLMQVDVPVDSVDAHVARYADTMVRDARVEVSEILVDSRAMADSLKTLVSKQPFALLAQKHTLRPGAARTGGSLGFVAQRELGVIGPDVFAAAEGDVLGPYALAGRYALVQVGPRQSADPLASSELRAFAQRQVRYRMGERAVDDHLSLLRETTDIQADFAQLSALPLYTD